MYSDLRLDTVTWPTNQMTDQRKETTAPFIILYLHFTSKIRISVTNSHNVYLWSHRHMILRFCNFLMLISIF